MSGKSQSPRRLAITLLAAAVTLFSVLSSRAQNGIFADFTTSLGNFTCVLDYTNAPKAAANFIGLATGERPWLDLPSGRVRTNRFYDGLTFHRVIAGFMIQGGSPNGLGSDGPGYAFPDEFKPALRFSGVGVLAMANSGPKSNGAQYFITVAPTAWLNDVHTIFGWLVSGTNVVTAISQVTTDANSKPLTNVIVQRIAIRRVGSAAQAFDINGQGLPVARNVVLASSKLAELVTVSFTNRPFADNRIYTSTDLQTWAPTLLGIEGSTAGSSILYLSPTNAPQVFCQFVQVQYPSSTFAPKTLRGRTLTLSLSGGGVITIVFGSTGGGTYTYPPYPPGTISLYDWRQEPYRGYFDALYSGGFSTSLRLDFNSDTAGRFSGNATGTFTLSP